MAKSNKIIVQKAFAFKLDPQASYIIHLPNIEPDDLEAMRAWLKEQGMELDKILIITTETLHMWETLQLPKAT